MQSILIIGGCGFVGSNLCIYFKTAYPSARIIAMDNLKRRGSELNLPRLQEAGIEFIHGDIRNKEDFDEIGPVECIIEAAAEPSVLSGLDNTPDYLINTNLLGTINCLNFAARQKAKLVFLSTSRIYPFKLLDDVGFEETETRYKISQHQLLPGVSTKGISTDFPLNGPRSLYGATKLASELLITEYTEFLGLQAVINRCGVITGPWQMGKVDQGVIVLWMARHFWGKGLTYNGYGGQGKQVRDILHIHDLFRLVDWQLNNFQACSGKTWNAGGGADCSISLQELTAFCKSLTGNSIAIPAIYENRKADVRMYITDNTAITKATGWKPNYTPVSILSEIYQWIVQHQAILQPILN